ncbi:hypothetical protein I4U23_016481 [Adineta vaga]|nr:hypothetical protein I4U23_016481 [Adineta vaga]
MMMMNTNHTYLYYGPNSISNFNRFHVNHTHFDSNVDFDSRILHGHVQLDIKKIIYKITLLSFKINTKSHLLFIDMKQIPMDIISISILIYYSTSSNQSKALQWMSKEQTADRQYPFMYSQCRAIHARSLYPCQDTSGVKSTYTAKISCPKPLIAVQLMSAIETKHDIDTNTFYFEQTIVAPSYLIAIAVGHVVSVIVHELTHSWTGNLLIGLLAKDNALIDFGSTNPYTCLVYRLKNIDPDDVYNSTQYYKGAALL